MATKRVIVHIDRLTLTGFRPEDRHAVSAGLQQELTRMFADREAVSGLSAIGNLSRLRVSDVPLGHGRPPSRAGQEIAQAIGRKIAR
jgi:hypothetical protein